MNIGKTKCTGAQQVAATGYYGPVIIGSVSSLSALRIEMANSYDSCMNKPFSMQQEESRDTSCWGTE